MIGYPMRENWLEAALYRGRWFLFVLALVLTAFAWPLSTRLQFDQSIEALYSEHDPQLLRFRESRDLFGGDEFVFVAYADPDLNTPAGLKRTEQLAQRVEDIPGVLRDSVQYLGLTLRQARLPFINLKEADVRELIRGILLGEDGITTAIALRLAPLKPIHRGSELVTATKVPRNQTIQSLKDLAKDFQRETGFETFVVGEPIHVQEGFRFIEEDGQTLWLYSSGLLVVVILGLFQSLRWTLLPLTVVWMTVIWTRAILVFSGLRLSMVSSMLNSLVTIIGVATVIHLAVQFREFRRELGREHAWRRTFRQLMAPIFWTSATTALGFCVLLLSHISPVRSFGLMMTIGSLLVLVAVGVVLPAGVMLGSRGYEVGRVPLEEWLDRQLLRIANAIHRAPRTTAAIMLLLMLWSGIGCFGLRIETDFSRNFRNSSEIVRGLNFLESKLGGAGTWEVNFPAPAKLTEEYLEEVAQLATRLKGIQINGHPGLTKIIAMPDAERLIPRTFLTGSLSRRLQLLNVVQPEFGHSLYSASGKRMRILLRARERQPSEDKLELIHRVETIAREQFPAAQTTGPYVLLTFLIDSLLRDQWISFALSGCGIWLCLILAYGNVWLGLISLVPNVFPILLLLGTMGWLGWPVNIATAMISCVSMGLTVDSSIHYLAGYLRHRRAGKDLFEALSQTQSEVGRALSFANFALVAGFLVLTVSHFLPLVYFGLLVSMAMLGGLVGNLCFLPLLLRWLGPSIGRGEMVENSTPVTNPS